MKCSESWLREWVNPELTREKLTDMLTMAGLELEEIAPVAKDFSGVVIGQILKIEKHPEADRLNICDVIIGQTTPLKIVCGAPNVKVGMRIPVAQIGAVLPGDLTIKHTAIRGVASEGMLCSASELGLSDDQSGLMELSEDAQLGMDLRNYLHLNDHTIDLSITPNRGDCLSVRGVAREIAAVTHTPLKPLDVSSVLPVNDELRAVSIKAKSACPHYVGRVIRNVKADLQTPIWLKERLRRSGVRSISPIVDVTNYVMLELGQPMHAFDLNKINKNIVVRFSKQGERIVLLDGTIQDLDDATLIIADAKNPLAIAGVMGGLDSSVTLLTTDIFLESAFFTPEVIAKQRQRYGLNSDSSYRFERGVDPTIQLEAIERATRLIIDIVGGEAGPATQVMSKSDLPKRKPVTLTKTKLQSYLGTHIADADVERIFSSLGFTFTSKKNAWVVTIPAYRFDVSLPEDLIEEVARIYGYDHIPTQPIRAALQANTTKETSQDLQGLRQALCHSGYHEVITYSFVDKTLQALLEPAEEARSLLNPMTSEMEVMRTNLWSGLVNTLIYNKSRQQHRVRLFEIGKVFLTRGETLHQLPRIAGLMTGLVEAEQWGMPAREADFYDLKGDIENILGLTHPITELEYKPESHPALHPGQSAGIYYKGQKLGIFGALHPSVLEHLDINGKVYVFELDLMLMEQAPAHQLNEISRFPEIRRDIALLVNGTIPAKQIQDTIREVAGDWLKDVFVFDVYQGKGITPGQKSIALAMILQHSARTLVDDEINDLMSRVISALKGHLGAELRS